MRRNLFPTNLLLAATLTLSATTTNALTELGDESLASIDGTGLAFPFEDFYLQMAPTSFIELTGDDPTVGTTTFIRGDLRYYGLTLSRGTTGGPGGAVTTSNLVNLDGSTCSNSGFFGLGCPASTDGIVNFANFDNPYIWRAFNYSGYDTSGVITDQRAVFEILGPSDMDAFRWSLMGELESGRTYGALNNGFRPITGASCAAGTGDACLSQYQNIILGKPVSRLKPISIGGTNTTTNPFQAPALRFFQYAGTTSDTGNNPATYGIQYEHRLSGDYRLTVNTTSGSAPARGDMPVFTNEEGLYFKDVQAYLSLGQLHYQALVFDDTQAGSTGSVTTNGNIAIELTAIPNVAAVYNDFYSLAPGDTQGFQRFNRPDRYYQTHGYAEWGTNFPTCTGGGANGAVQCMSGNGVSGLRYTGVDPDGPTQVINQTNFPASTCNVHGTGVGGRTGENCAQWSGQTVGNVVSGSATRSAIVAAGGMVFVSRNGSATWQVTNNQNYAPQETLNMLWVETYEESCGFFCTDDQSRLTRDARYNSSPNGNGDYYNPTLNVSSINLGSSRITGLQINHMKIETLGGK